MEELETQRNSEYTDDTEELKEIYLKDRDACDLIDPGACSFILFLVRRAFGLRVVLFDLPEQLLSVLNYADHFFPRMLKEKKRYKKTQGG